MDPSCILHALLTYHTSLISEDRFVLLVCSSLIWMYQTYFLEECIPVVLYFSESCSRFSYCLPLSWAHDKIRLEFLVTRHGCYAIMFFDLNVPVPNIQSPSQGTSKKGKGKQPATTQASFTTAQINSLEAHVDLLIHCKTQSEVKPP